MSVTNSLMKQAAESIRTLVKEREEFEKSAEISELSRKIINTMIEREMLSTNQVLSKLAEFENKSYDELRIVQEALKLGANSFSKLGELSDKSDNDGLSAKEKFIHAVIGDIID